MNRPTLAPAVLAAARAAGAAGFSVLPARRDGSKCPVALPIPPGCDQATCVEGRDRARAERRPARGWRHFTHAALAPADLPGAFARAEGLCLLMGAVSGGAVLLETDDEGAAELLRAAAYRAGAGAVMERLDSGYTEVTPGGGTHWLLRVEGGAGRNERLACRPKMPHERHHEHDRLQVVAETRGEGGQAVVAPSGGRTHPTGRPYRLVAGSFATVPTLTAAEWSALADAARSLDRMPAPPVALRRPGRPYHGPSTADRFNAGASWPELLEPHGWRRWGISGENEHWTRPGRAGGTSATINDHGAGLLYVFTSSTAFEPGRAYSKFGAFAVLEHGGDCSAAARALRSWWAA